MNKELIEKCNVLAQRVEKLAAERDALAAELQKAKGDRDIWAAEHERQIKEKRALADELERERIRLAACGVVAISDTLESAKLARGMHEDYKSASCDDVARRVDECIGLRAELKALREQKPVGFRFHGMVIAEYEHEESFWAKGWSFSEEKPKSHFSGIEHTRDIEPLYAIPVPARELTDETIQRHWDEACKDTPQTPGWSRHIRFARAIERHMKGEGK